jgi:hypothetical protein
MYILIGIVELSLTTPRLFLPLEIHDVENGWDVRVCGEKGWWMEAFIGLWQVRQKRTKSVRPLSQCAVLWRVMPAT